MTSARPAIMVSAAAPDHVATAVSAAVSTFNLNDRVLGYPDLAGIVFLSVAGMAKELCIITLAIMLFGDELSLMNWKGVLTTLLAI